MVRVKGFELQKEGFLAPPNCGPHSMLSWSMLRSSSGGSSLPPHKMQQVKQVGSNILLSLSLEGFWSPAALRGEV